MHQRFCRNRQEFFFEGRSQDHRPFHQRGDFFQQSFFDIGDTTQLLGSRFSTGLDEGFTRFVISLHFAFFQQQRRILVSMADFKLSFAHETVTTNDTGRVQT